MAVISGIKKEKTGALVPLVIVALVLGLGGFLFWYLQRPAPPQPGPVLSEEARTYIRAGGLKLSGVEMKAAKSYMNQMLVEITGNITNSGGRPLRQVDLHCVFYDPYGQLVLRDLTSIVKQKAGGLTPGETKSFRLAFDTLPESWNQQMPQLVIARIVFE